MTLIPVLEQFNLTSGLVMPTSCVMLCPGCDYGASLMNKYRRLTRAGSYAISYQNLIMGTMGQVVVERMTFSMLTQRKARM